MIVSNEVLVSKMKIYGDGKRYVYISSYIHSLWYVQTILHNIQQSESITISLMVRSLAVAIPDRRAKSNNPTNTTFIFCVLCQTQIRDISCNSVHSLVIEPGICLCLWPNISKEALFNS